ncbi:unnamed protein product [Soboliphyme baturini]|uniref:Uncharacterized protein n=1 Tax=Soboliphyme baturini TaxID=241478 RepID=A0A183IVG2_9BILA|nr:unnamed protein product [Soboliphyme baturini]
MAPLLLISRPNWLRRPIYHRVDDQKRRRGGINYGTTMANNNYATGRQANKQTNGAQKRFFYISSEPMRLATPQSRHDLNYARETIEHVPPEPPS